MKKVITIIGARPQFIKHSPVDKIIKKYANNVVIHTGQHFDENMSNIFFSQLEIDKPDYNLQISGFNHGKMTGEMMINIEDIILKEKPDFIVVYGDTNSTLAGAMVGAKLHIPIIHIESGLRSGDKAMPEEINRVTTDHISKYLFCPTDTSLSNLKKEGLTDGVIKVEDPMYLTVNYFKEKALKKDIITKLGLSINNFYFATIHRPSNTDNRRQLESIINLLNSLDKKVLIPVHPRTKIKLHDFKIKLGNNIILIEPCGYVETINFMFNCSAVITDSGGLQKEAYILGKNIFTLRNKTEWVETVNSGKNTLLLNDDGYLLKGTRNLIESYRGGEYINYYGQGEKIDSVLSKILI